MAGDAQDAGARYSSLVMIITGCARSGTMRISQAIEAAGIICPHEPEVNKPLYRYKVFVSWLAAHSATSEDIVWHVTRDPILVAASLKRAEVFGRHIQNEYIDIAIDTIGDDFLDSSIPELDYWLDWNLTIESCHPVYRFDTASFSVRDIMRVSALIGEKADITDEVRETISAKHINTGGNEYIGFDLSKYKRLPELRDMCARYGYAIP